MKLKNLINDTYIDMRIELGFTRIENNELVQYVMQGMSVSSERYKAIALNYTCDDVANTLLHECVHLKYPTMEEYNVEILTDELWKDKEIRKAAQNRIVKEYGKLNL